MSKTKVIVVGAGIAGIVASYFEARKGNEVTLVDTAKEPGGLLRSNFNGKSYFDYGTHILPETQVKEVDEFLFGDLKSDNYLITKKIAAGNYYAGKLNEKSCYVDSSCLSDEDYNKCGTELLSTESHSNKDLAEFFTSRYGKTLYEKIFKDVTKKYIGIDAKELNYRIGYFFDMSRVLAFDQKIVNNLHKIDLFNNILGHHERVDGVYKYYPKTGGVGSLIQHLVRKIEKEKVNVITGAQIKSIKFDDNRVSMLEINDEKFDCDRLVWSVPLIFLANFAKITKKSIKPEFRNTTLYDFTFKSPVKTNCCFINVYEPNLNSGRITIYQNLGAKDEGGYSCTVEVLSDEVPDPNMILNELDLMGLIDDKSNCVFQQMRKVENGFPILTNEYVVNSEENNKFYREQFSNVVFIGKASEDAFFMTDVLNDAYKKLVSY